MKSKFDSLIGRSCIVTLLKEKRSGTIEAVIHEGQILELSEFRVQLDDGQLVIVPGGMLSDIVGQS